MQNDKRFRIILRAMGVAVIAGGLLGLAGCHHSSVSASTGPDPADANMAAPNGQTQVLGESASYSPQQQGEQYPEGQQAPAPIVQGTPNAEQSYPGGYGPDEAEEAGEEAIEQTTEAPPPLPEYDQPPCPGPDYIWTPGYWAWGPDGYYWVPGAWVEAPYYGALWTPPYWGWYDGYYRFYPGYWGPHVGFYGGIDYGFGYIGVGFFGGYWSGNHFYYNRAVTHLGGGIHDYYSRPVVYNNVHYGARPANRVSYNGGRGGLSARPNASEMAAAHERHDPAMAVQRQARTAASQNRGQFYAQNHGRPATVAENRGFANGHGIAAPPRGVEPGRAEPNRAPAGAHNPAARGEAEHGFNGARPGGAPNGSHMNPRENPGERNNAQPPRNVEPNRGRPAPRTENRPAPQQQHMENRAAPQQQRMENRAAPQQHFANRPAPQPRAEAPRTENRPAPQQHFENRPAPQQHMENRPAAAPRAAAPHPEARPAPQGHPGGGDEHHR